MAFGLGIAGRNGSGRRQKQSLGSPAAHDRAYFAFARPGVPAVRRSFFQSQHFTVKRLLFAGRDETVRLVMESAQSHGAAADSRHGRGLQHLYAARVAAA